MLVVLKCALVYLGGVMDALGSVRTRLGWLLGSLLLASTGGCGDDGPADSGTAGSSANGGSSAGSSASAGTGGSAMGTAGSTMGGVSGGGDLSALCMTVCSNYYAACPVEGLGNCPDHCSSLLGRSPASCSSLELQYFTCLSTRTPMCGSGSWSEGYDEECNSDGRSLCLKTKGAECIAGEDYDNVLCETGNEGMYGYYCQKDVAPKAGCIVSTKTTRNGLHCCEEQLSL